MKYDKNLQAFVSILDADLSIGKNHLVDDLPETFTAPDFLYFFALRDQFWADMTEKEQIEVSAAMTECYLSALLHISSGDYTFTEENHHLEHCILYGDLLSGAFSGKLIELDKTALLKEWLLLLQRINKELLTYSLEERSTSEKKVCLVTRLVEALTKTKNVEAMVADAKAMLCDNIWPESSALPHDFLADVAGKRMTSALDLQSMRE